ncbi:carboxylesterase family domain-containing protein [Ditylenchus destructor]|nr:carboxylesterase family domain-containing protein [Ditylenchus destructor]
MPLFWSTCLMVIVINYVRGNIPPTLKDEKNDYPKISEKHCVAKNHAGNEIHGFEIDMGTREEVLHKAIYYGKEGSGQPNKEYEHIHKDKLPEFGPACMQNAKHESENCLTLNVFAPPADKSREHKDGHLKGKKSKTDEIEKDPVYVHFHGGALTTNSGGEFGYLGIIRNFVSQGIVVVTINYRLGPYGFLQIFDQKELNTERQKKGMKDAIMSLEWVKKNIEGFGGDPNRITVGGDSAGATVLEFLALALNRKTHGHFNLFHRIILLGGTADLCTKHMFIGRDLEDKFKDKECKDEHGKAKTGHALWECLLKADLMKPEPVSTDEEKFYSFWGIKTPDVSRKDQKHTFSDVARGMFEHWEPVNNHFPVFMVESRDEWALFDSFNIKKEAKDKGIEHYNMAYLKHTLKDILKPYDQIKHAHHPNWVEENVNDIANKLVDIYKVDIYGNEWLHKHNDHLSPAEYYRIIMRIVTNYLWSIRSIEDAIRFKNHALNVFMMKFAYANSHRQTFAESPVVQHSQDKIYAFMPEKNWKKDNSPYHNIVDLEVADKMAQLLANFIYNGDPNKSKRPVKAFRDNLPVGAGWPALAFGNGVGPHYFQLSKSEHHNAPKKGTQAHHGAIEVKKMGHWLSEKILEYWCNFFVQNGRTPLTVHERKLIKEGHNLENKEHDFAICSLTHKGNHNEGGQRKDAKNNNKRNGKNHGGKKHGKKDGK